MASKSYQAEAQQLYQQPTRVELLTAQTETNQVRFGKRDSRWERKRAGKIAYLPPTLLYLHMHLFFVFFLWRTSVYFSLSSDAVLIFSFISALRHAFYLYYLSTFTLCVLVCKCCFCSKAFTHLFQCIFQSRIYVEHKCKRTHTHKHNAK